MDKVMVKPETTIDTGNAPPAAATPVPPTDRTQGVATSVDAAPPLLAQVAPTQIAPTQIAPASITRVRHVNGDNYDSFETVMTRVAAILNKASLSGPGREHSVDSLVVDTLEMSTRGTSYPAEPVPTEDSLSGTPPDIASNAALFLAESTPAPNGSGPLHDSGPGPDRVSAEPDDAVAEALRRTGLGDSLVRAVSEARRHHGLEAALLEAFSTFVPGPPLPRRPGSLLVVVGAGVAARRLAASLADEIGVDPAAIPFASLDAGAYGFVTGPLLVRSAEEGAERAPGWRRSQAAVVVVDSCVTGPDRSWATHLITALHPTAVWGVVDSTSKTEDIAAWAEALGGIDALALENIDATVSPASALGAGIAVTRLDGQPATAARWASALAARIGPCS